MNWESELAAMATEAAGDMGLLVALVALRKTENGGPGREFGVLSVPAPSYADQLRIAANSLEHREREAPMLARTSDGFYTPDFLAWFSSQWAPVNAENDPHGLNLAHSHNLRLFAATYAAVLRATINTFS